MKEEIIFLVSILFFIGFISAVQEPFIYYKLNLDYSYGNLSINSTEIEFSNRHIENNFGFYSAMVLDFDGNILNLTFFDVPNVIFYDATDPETGKITGGGLMEFNETQSEIYVPYYKNAKEMVIYDQNTNELIRKSVREYSDIRNLSDNTGNLNDNGKEGGNLEIQKNNFIEKLSEYWWILAIVFIILLIILFTSINKRK
ncbi:hypothetical protein J4233_06445 [Candidatus Pacearchaeota archaeon]|nr:hypothetical protein [Candidatus Pacearchaeota archaeon]